ncbi:MAG: 6,7-dimethyl-8-ribityllumazine synthase [Gammaproteobacteria bacterium]|nr:6,7-dimethyl-8-ribityllumazine synthase [Sideroxydans sp.]MBU3904199.1 6,7-dimethyl-8-ribityllumazine synthase [Gammaproteobacteria bacterium]MBU4045878.1 6,7-dimethyl-8-ribityllumazine synthase [Gammaproteobacteria bacterium]MBU4150276.1 6,7-dimethyl-8-ribityllumazine synthase [Gammaproteobacteria bacterium]
MKEIKKNLDGTGMRIGIVQSRFNDVVCDGLLAACHAQLLKSGVADDDIVLATVPGALEIPLVLWQMAESHDYDALIALGAVIRGDTYHFEIVSNESARGVGEVQLATGMPIANAILTTDTDEQAEVRMSVKGAEAALVAIEMVNLARELA